MIKARKIDEETVEVEYLDGIKEIFEGTEEELMSVELSNKTGIELVALILHAVQQGVSRKLLIHGYEIRPLVMDQTGGYIRKYDIVGTNHPSYPYQRLSNVMANTYEP